MPARNPHNLGAVDVSTILGYASKLPQYAETIAEVINDPYLPETACRIDQIYEARHGLPIKACTKTPPTQVKSGVGLQRVMPALRFAAYAEQHKWAYLVGIGAVIGLPFLLGYSMGSRRRKS